MDFPEIVDPEIPPPTGLIIASATFSASAILRDELDSSGILSYTVKQPADITIKVSQAKKNGAIIITKPLGHHESGTYSDWSWSGLVEFNEVYSTLGSRKIMAERDRYRIYIVANDGSIQDSAYCDISIE